ncbi:helix-turn-helix domain-containing protein [Pseudaeromonas sharmana]|uniref:Helix-turn-helix domain-containing protein n=1 Tax=Pseudaeromonas sharmana TaxID=328412 RepID=A0ABV8CQS4_9GAMM
MAQADFQRLLATRLRQLREQQGWSLEQLAEQAGVSRSNISSIERGQSSPTAAVLDRLATALGIPLASLFAGLQVKPTESPCYRHDEQDVWVDPASGYQRRRLTALQAAPLQMVEVVFPPGQRVSYEPLPLATDWHQQIWMLEGRMQIHSAGIDWQLMPGDCLCMSIEGGTEFFNPGDTSARYLVALTRGQTL